MAKVSRTSKLKQWTREELNTLRREYPKTDTKLLARKLGRTLEAVRFKAKRFGLKKSRAYMEALYVKARNAGQKRSSKKR